MGGGGKGGSSSSSAEIPSWIAEPATRNLARAEQIAKIGYQPYYGADVAAFTPAQEAVMQSNIDAAKAFGLVSPDSNLSPTSGMPEPQTFAGGITGYSASPMFNQAVAELKARKPKQSALYNSLFDGKPLSSETASTMAAPDGYTWVRSTLSPNGAIQLVPTSSVQGNWMYQPVSGV